MRLGVALLVLALLLSFSPIVSALCGPVRDYTETMIDLSIGKASVDTKVALIAKIYYKDSASDEWVPFNNPPVSPYTDPPTMTADTLFDFYVYKGLKAKKDLEDDCTNPTQRAYLLLAGDSIAPYWQNVNGEGTDQAKNWAKIEIDNPSSDACFVSVVYWGYEKETAPGVYDSASSYRPAVATIPACGEGGTFTLNNIALDTGLCLPLVLLLGLLLASMYVQGKNALAGFDFSSPRASGGKQYSMRKGGAINAWGTVLTNIGTYAATQVVQKLVAKAEVKNLKGKEKELQGRVEKLDGRIKEKEKELSERQMHYVSGVDGIGEPRAELTTRAELTSLQGQHAAAKAELGRVTNSLQTARKKVESMRIPNVGYLFVQKIMTKAKVKNLKGKEKDLQGRVEKLDSDIGRLEKELSELQSHLLGEGSIVLDLVIGETRAELTNLRGQRADAKRQLRRVTHNLQTTREKVKGIRIGKFEDLDLFRNTSLQAGSPVGIRGYPIPLWSLIQFAITGGKSANEQEKVGGTAGSGRTDMAVGVSGDPGTGLIYVVGQCRDLYRVVKGEAFKVNLNPTQEQIATGLSSLLSSIPLTARFYDLWTPMVNMLVSSIYRPRTEESRDYYRAAKQEEKKLERLLREKERPEEEVARLRSEREAAVRTKGEGSPEVTEIDGQIAAASARVGDIDRQITAASLEVARNYALAWNADARSALINIAEIVGGREGLAIRDIMDGSLTDVQKAALLRELDVRADRWQEMLGDFGYKFDFTVIKNVGQLNEMMASLDGAIDTENSIVSQLGAATDAQTIGKMSFQRKVAVADSRFVYSALSNEVMDIAALRRDGDELVRSYEKSSEEEIRSNTQGFIGHHGAVGIAYLELVNAEWEERAQPDHEVSTYLQRARSIVINEEKLNQEKRTEALVNLNENTSHWRERMDGQGVQVDFTAIANQTPQDALTMLDGLDTNLLRLPWVLNGRNLANQNIALAYLAEAYNNRKDANGSPIVPDVERINTLLGFYAETVQIANQSRGDALVSEEIGKKVVALEQEIVAFAAGVFVPPTTAGGSGSQ